MVEAAEDLIEGPAAGAVRPSGTPMDKAEEEKKDEMSLEKDDRPANAPPIPIPSSITKDDDKTPSEVKREVIKERVAQAMTLDVAYQSLEMIRKTNLLVEFGKEVEDDQCVTCLRAEHSSSVVKSKFGKWMSKKAASPCLTCGLHVCSSHRSTDFGKQNITICSDCAHLFSTNYLVHHVMQEDDPAEKKSRLNSMLEVYDRALLVLLYSTQFIDEVVIALQGNTSRHNKIGLGSSATGVVAGGLGVAGK